MNHTPGLSNEYQLHASDCLAASAPEMLAALIVARSSIDVSRINNSKRSTEYWTAHAAYLDDVIAKAKGGAL